MDDFAISVERLEGAVRQGCATEEEWPARIAAGIQATVEFVVDHPLTARALAVDLDLVGLERRYVPVIERFSRMLATETPTDPGRAPSVERAVVGGIASVIANHVRSERSEELEGQAQDLIYFALMPYLGYEGAKHWVDSATE